MTAPPADAQSPVRAALIGATGRMGRALLCEVANFPRLRVTGAIASPSSPGLGRDAGELAGVAPLGVVVASDLARALADADVAIDFSQPTATRANLMACRTARKPLLLCATGYDAALERDLSAAAREIALLVAANTSIGVTVLVELARMAARLLPARFDIDIVDSHHRAKRDAPSGTALLIGAAARESRPVPPTAGEPSVGRVDGEVRFTSLRAGDVVGEHTVLFSGAGEQLSLTHRATDRAIFARGALAAALWLQSRPVGRYSMGDVLSLQTMAY